MASNIDSAEISKQVYQKLPRSQPITAMGSVVKIGPFGSNGTPQDINAVPLLLQSITVRSGDVLDNLGFAYKDSKNKSSTGGPWGGNGGGVTTTGTQIQLGDSEYVSEIVGTHGSYFGHAVIAKLIFVTNQNRYGPFGAVDLDGSVPFSVPVANGSIVGFFASTGSLYVSSIGVYARPF